MEGVVLVGGGLGVEVVQGFDESTVEVEFCHEPGCGEPCFFIINVGGEDLMPFIVFSFSNGVVLEMGW